MARKKFVIELDKSRSLSMGLAEIGEIESFFDKGMSQVFGKERMGVQVILVSLWVCLKAEDPALTLSKVTTLVEESIEEGKTSIEAIGEQLGEMVQVSGLLPAKKVTSPTP